MGGKGDHSKSCKYLKNSTTRKEAHITSYPLSSRDLRDLHTRHISETREPRQQEH